MKGQLPYHGLVLNVIYWLADHAILPGDDVILPGGEPAGIINKYQIEIDQAERHESEAFVRLHWNALEYKRIDRGQVPF